MVYVLSAENLYPGSDYRITLPRVTGAQLVTLTGTGLGGFFTLLYKGLPTAALPYNATAAQVQSALEVLSGLGVGTITVTGSPGGPWTITSARPVDPNLFISPPLSYNLSLLTGTGISMTIVLVAQNCTGFTYFLQARSHPPLPVTANIQIDAGHTTQGSITNHGATGLIDFKILGSAIESLNFTYTDVEGGTSNNVAQFNILENDTVNTTIVITGNFILQPRVYQ